MPEPPVKSPLPLPPVLRAVAREAWPGPPLRRLLVDNTGWTNLMMESDNRIMFRFPRWVDSARSLGREVHLLEFLARHLTIPIPRPFLVGTMDRPRGWPFFAYEKLPGSPLTDVSTLRHGGRRRLTRFLVKLFSELSNCPTTQLRILGLPPGDKSAWADRFKGLERRYRRVAADRMPVTLHGRIVERFGDFFDTLSISRFRPTLIHADLWPSHILWSRTSNSPVGVIDWEDARFGDPAFDLSAFGGIGAEFTRKLVESRQSRRDESFEERLLFYRRILPLQGLLFGIETGRAAIARSHLRELRGTVELQRL